MSPEAKTPELRLRSIRPGIWNLQSQTRPLLMSWTRPRLSQPGSQTLVLRTAHGSPSSCSPKLGFWWGRPYFPVDPLPPTLAWPQGTHPPLPRGSSLIRGSPRLLRTKCKRHLKRSRKGHQKGTLPSRPRLCCLCLGNIFFLASTLSPPPALSTHLEVPPPQKRFLMLVQVRHDLSCTQQSHGGHTEVSRVSSPCCPASFLSIPQG